MDILRGQSDAALAQTDDLMYTGSCGCDRNDAFVADDIVRDAPCVNGYAGRTFDDGRYANESGPETCLQQQAPPPVVPAPAAVSTVGRLVFAAPPRPVQRAH